MTATSWVVMDAVLLVLLNLGGITALPYLVLDALLPVVMGEGPEPNSATMATKKTVTVVIPFAALRPALLALPRAFVA